MATSRRPSPAKRRTKQNGGSLLGVTDEDLKATENFTKGPIRVDADELNAAFAFFDTAGKGRLTPKDLYQKLSAFYPGVSAKEVKALITEPVFTKEVLRKLMEGNQLAGFDPVRHSFAAFDPDNTGFVDPATLRAIFERLGYGEITDDDMAILVETADVDGDGRISLEDFRAMLKVPPRATTAATG